VTEAPAAAVSEEPVPEQPVAPVPKPQPAAPVPSPKLPIEQPAAEAERASAESAEVEWSRLHPAGFVENPAPGRWILWNFDVGSARLKAAHRRGLDAIASAVEAMTTSGAPPSVSVKGYASASGSAAGNTHLSILRAQQVEAYLRGKPGNGGLITPSGLGVHTQRGVDPASLARSRQVEVTISAVTSPPPLSRVPLPPPRLEPKGTPKAITRTVEEGRRLPSFRPSGFAVEWKDIRIQLPKASIGPYLEVQAEGEVVVKLEVTTPVHSTVVAEIKGGKLDFKVKEEAGSISWANTSKGIAVQFKDGLLQPQLDINVKRLLSEPAELLEELAKEPAKVLAIASLKFTSLDRKWEEKNLGRFHPLLAGLEGKVQISPKLTFNLGPSRALLARLTASLAARLAPVAVPIAGGVIGGAALTILALYLVNEAHKRGERWAEVSNFRRGYARRLAAEAADWLPGRGISSTRGWEAARGLMLESWRADPGLFDKGYAQLYDGWQAADTAIKLLPVESYDAAMKALRSRFGIDFFHLERAIYNRIGGASKEPIRPPTDIALIR
jgi:outer membrane protein OmpA-like peptidoglycan-associated protein